LTRRKTSKPRLRVDIIGAWSEIKLEIVRKFAQAYSSIFNSPKQRHRFHHVYVDAFAGSGVHLSKTRGDLVAGSPMQALQIQPPFREYHFIDLDGHKVAALHDLVRNRPVEAHIHHGDCNEILLTKIFPTVRYADYRRALCLLDPYGLHLRWEVMRKAGELRTIDMLLNFPVADMNRNVLWRHPERVDPADVARMTAFWGDESWRDVAYVDQPTLFGVEQEKTDNETIARAFRERLHKVAGFPYVAPPLPMRTSQNAILYYLFFASHNATAERIIRDIFRRYGAIRG
jgi:three-Cys-motif partner protein